MNYNNIIIIPYRDRKDHLNYYLDNVLPLIKDNMIDTKVLIIEQIEGKPFNRGKLLNIGFKEYENKTKYFITHDVDTIPNENIINKYYNNDCEVLSLHSSHSNSLGGVIKISSDVVISVNGFPNNIWGWGIEDRALYNRVLIKKHEIKRAKLEKDFLFLDHKSNKVKYKDIKKEISDIWRAKYINSLSNDEKKRLIYFSGLNDLEYTVIKRDINNNIEHITVKI